MTMRRFAGVGLIAAVLAPGCASSPETGGLPLLALGVLAGLENSSPTQQALGARASVRIATFDQGGVLAVGGVQRQWFDGGHDNVFTAGLQARRIVNARAAWIGAEGTYNNWRVSDDELNPVATVFGVNGLAGLPIGGGGVHLWGSGGLLFFADFKADGIMVYEGGSGWQVNVGVEFRNLFGGN